MLLRAMLGRRVVVGLGAGGTSSISELSTLKELVSPAGTASVMLYVLGMEFGRRVRRCISGLLTFTKVVLRAGKASVGLYVLEMMVGRRVFADVAVVGVLSISGSSTFTKLLPRAGTASVMLYALCDTLKYAAKVCRCWRWGAAGVSSISGLSNLT